MPETNFVDFGDCVKKNQGLVDNPEEYCKNLIAGQTQQQFSSFTKEAHSSKWHSCVEQVSAQGKVSSPEAVCTAALGSDSFESLELQQFVLEIKQAMSFENWETSLKTEDMLKKTIKEMRGVE